MRTCCVDLSDGQSSVPSKPSGALLFFFLKTHMTMLHPYASVPDAGTHRLRDATVDRLHSIEMPLSKKPVKAL
jgi:hypothetical protein